MVEKPANPLSYAMLCTHTHRSVVPGCGRRRASWEDGIALGVC
jgi:hypothetical protein